LRKALQGYGYQVLLTREEDRFLSLGERSAFANQVEADLFLSLHLNAEASGRVAGVETFVFTPFNQPSTARSRLHTSDRRVYPGNRNDTWNTLAGYHLQRALKEHTGTRDRGLKRARFAVLRETAVPAVLLELGFISHGPTARLARTARQQQLWTEAIVAGVLDYQGALNQVRGK
jgi:N-acetylmuramoyl-L-alanine amidase